MESIDRLDKNSQWISEVMEVFFLFNFDLPTTHNAN